MQWGVKPPLRPPRSIFFPFAFGLLGAFCLLCGESSICRFALSLDTISP